MTQWPNFNSFDYHDVVIRLNNINDERTDIGLKWTIRTPFDLQRSPPQPFHVMCSIKECTKGEEVLTVTDS